MPSLSKSVAFIKSFDASSEEQRKRLIEEVYGGSRNKLKEAACALISSPRFAQKMAVRLGALSVLVYLGADAVPEIAGILKKRSKPLDYEIHFSLFCRLERERYKNSAKQKSECCNSCSHTCSLFLRQTAKQPGWLATYCIIGVRHRRSKFFALRPETRNIRLAESAQSTAFNTSSTRQETAAS